MPQLHYINIIHIFIKNKKVCLAFFVGAGDIIYNRLRFYYSHFLKHFSTFFISKNIQPETILNDIMHHFIGHCMHKLQKSEIFDTVLSLYLALTVLHCQNLHIGPSIMGLLFFIKFFNV